MKTLKKCKGPCLPHCYNDEKVMYLIIGFVIGIISYALVERILVKPKDEKPRTDLFPSTSD